jgi:Mycothiol maleylpyruvate isomerase N-terminal domain
MSGGRAELEDALAAAYGQLTDVTGDLTEAAALLPTRCAGWAVADVLYHQLLDARRALVTFATPSPAPPDVDEVSYWRPFSAGGAVAPGTEGPALHARHVRIVASAYSPGLLAQEWAETAAAAVRAARACRHDVVSTQGHAITVTDFLCTLVVEATVHYLDLTVALPAAPAAAALALAQVRRVLTGLAGAPLPASWDDVTCTLKCTGRAELTADDRAAPGALSGRLPLLG